ncbi:hypothetical protein [Streptomyces sp. 2A115]|uniref:hypothetical protein n=1 Tax=Streptomyces sp. 2A115 TaxID=3457439 RepID=UPI003FD05BBB
MVDWRFGGVVDQGLAAVLGALAGAAATAGGAYLTAHSSITLYRRQTRRDAYRAFLLDADGLSERLNAMIPDSHDAQSLAEPPGTRDALQEVEVVERTLRRAVIDVQLTGTDDIANVAMDILIEIATLRRTIETWWNRPTGTPIPDVEWHSAATSHTHLQEHMVLFGDLARQQV